MSPWYLMGACGSLNYPREAFKLRALYIPWELLGALSIPWEPLGTVSSAPCNVSLMQASSSHPPFSPQCRLMRPIQVLPKAPAWLNLNPTCHKYKMVSQIQDGVTNRNKTMSHNKTLGHKYLTVPEIATRTSWDVGPHSENSDILDMNMISIRQ